MTFPRVLTLCEMQTASFEIWTQVAESISYDNNYYLTNDSLINYWAYIMCLTESFKILF